MWTGLRRAHCPVCHETFNSDSAADKHRAGKFGIDRHCISPQDAGLVAVEQLWGVCWQAPDSGRRFAVAKVYDGRPDYEGNMRRFEQDLLDGTVGGSLSTPVPLPPADPREPQGTTPDGK